MSINDPWAHIDDDATATPQDIVNHLRNTGTLPPHTRLAPPPVNPWDGLD